MTIDFVRLQESLGPACAANTPGSALDHVLILLPSFSVGESLLAHYAPRIPALEHRYVLAMLMLPRIRSCELVFVTCSHPGQEIIDYYASLFPAETRAEALSRFHVVEASDHTPRPIAAKLLDRPDVIAALRDRVSGRLAFIEPWNVTAHEVDVALALGVPINGTTPDLWPLGYKSAGRRLFAEAGVPMPLGTEDVKTVDDVLRAIATIRAEHPDASGVVIKHDDSGAGDGNAVIGLRGHGSDASETAVRHRIDTLPAWYLADLGHGSVVEELISGAGFASPSVQVDISPYGEVSVCATHDQELDPATGQVYTGCRFPARPEYAAEIARHGIAVGEQLARRGAVGRFSVDFAAACDLAGAWQVFALEINLRKGGTTHPFSVLRHLAPGRYDAASGSWLTDDGTPRAYMATDNLVDPAWLGLAPHAVISAVEDAGLRFDPASGTGVVLHMLSCLAIDGRLGLTAIGRTPDHAARLFEAARTAIHAHARPAHPLDAVPTAS